MDREPLGREQDVNEPVMVIVTAEVRFPLTDVMTAYADALTPDGGVPSTVTFNAYLAEYAFGVGRDMVGANRNADTFYEWRLSS